MSLIQMMFQSCTPVNYSVDAIANDFMPSTTPVASWGDFPTIEPFTGKLEMLSQSRKFIHSFLRILAVLIIRELLSEDFGLLCLTRGGLLGIWSALEGLQFLFKVFTFLSYELDSF